MFIRTKDSVKITDDNYEVFSFLNTSRKGNRVTKFNLNFSAVNFYTDALSIRMIPKDKMHILQEKDIKIITTEDGLSLVYQSFDEEPVRFISPDEDTDEVQPIDFFDIIPEETEILCFDNKTEGYYYSTVAYTSMLMTIVEAPDAPLDATTAHNNLIYQNELKNLSRYIIASNPEEGLILNGIMVI